MKCIRCSKAVHYAEACTFCDKTVCRACQKSSKFAINPSDKKQRIMICKTCWNKVNLRKMFLKPQFITRSLWFLLFVRRAVQLLRNLFSNNSQFTLTYVNSFTQQLHKLLLLCFQKLFLNRCFSSELKLQSFLH